MPQISEQISVTARKLLDSRASVNNKEELLSVSPIANGLQVFVKTEQKYYYFAVPTFNAATKNDSLDKWYELGTGSSTEIFSLTISDEEVSAKQFSITEEARDKIINNLNKIIIRAHMPKGTFDFYYDNNDAYAYNFISSSYSLTVYEGEDYAAITENSSSLEGDYATKDWVKEQGYVTASYLDGILTLSSEKGEIGTLPEDTTINELLDAKADNIPFTSTAITTHAVGDLAAESNLNGKSIQWILTKLLGIIDFVAAPVLTLNDKWDTLTIKNPNNFPVKLWITANDCRVQYVDGALTPVVQSSYEPIRSGKEILANETITISVDTSSYNFPTIKSVSFAGSFTHENGIESQEASISR